MPLDPRWFQAAWRFVVDGFFHILGGVDHLLFLLCLVIPFRRIAALVPIVTSFTIAHSITLIASAYDMAPGALWFPALVETLIAASIVYMALENIISPALRRRWMITFGFGLVHGFGFSFALRDSLQFAGNHLLTSLLSFNVGVEIGQLVVLVLVVPALDLLFRYGVAERIGTIVLSALVAHTGWHWMTERGAAAGPLPVRVAGLGCGVAGGAAAVADGGRGPGGRGVAGVRGLWREGSEKECRMTFRASGFRLQAPGVVLAALVAGVLATSPTSQAQAPPAPTNTAPNPYKTVEGYFKMPEGRTWGSTSAVEIDRDGRSIWVAERCGANSCLDRATGQMSSSPSILKFDASGKLVTSFGQGMLIFPHGIFVDRDGNLWVTDGQDDAPQPARGAAPRRRGGAQPPRRPVAPARSGPGPCPGPRAGTRCSSSAPTASCC